MCHNQILPHTKIFEEQGLRDNMEISVPVNTAVKSIKRLIPEGKIETFATKILTIITILWMLGRRGTM